MRAVTWLAVGAVLCAVAVAAGAFGAHGLESRLGERELALWETGSRYLVYAGLAVLGVGAAAVAGVPIPALCVWSLAAGGSIFAGTLYGLALGGPRWLGAVTPIGGLLMIVGFLLVAWSALRY